MGMFVSLTVAEDRCAQEPACRECVQSCPVDIFTREAGGVARVVAEHEDECILCDQCVVRCPVEAVVLTKHY